MAPTFPRKLFSEILTKADKILVLLILGIIILFSLRILLPKKEGPLQAICKVEGKVVCKIPLTEHKTINLDNGMILETGNNKIRVASSDCAKQICVKHGWIKQGRDLIICLPKETVIYLDATSEIDYISQ